MSDDGTGCDDGALADGDAGHNGRIHADKGAATNPNFPDDLFSFIKVAGQVVGDHDAHRGDGHIVFDGDQFGSAIVDQDHVADLYLFPDMNTFQAMEEGAESFPWHEPGGDLDAIAPEPGKF